MVKIHSNVVQQCSCCFEIQQRNVLKETELLHIQVDSQISVVE